MIVDNWLWRLHDLRLVLWMLNSHLVIGPHPSWLCLQRLKSPLHIRQRGVIFRVLQGAVIVRVAIGSLRAESLLESSLHDALFFDFPESVTVSTAIQISMRCIETGIMCLVAFGGLGLKRIETT